MLIAMSRSGKGQQVDPRNEGVFWLGLTQALSLASIALLVSLLGLWFSHGLGCVQPSMRSGRSAHLFGLGRPFWKAEGLM